MKRKVCALILLLVWLAFEFAGARVYAASAGLLVVVVAIALIGPARTATSIDPITVLRVE